MMRHLFTLLTAGIAMHVALSEAMKTMPLALS
jgi:hypothetical protein